MVLTFRVADDAYAVDARRIVEVVPRVVLRPIPHAPGSFVGLFHYRGAIAPVVDMGLLMGAAACRDSLSTRIILVDVPGRDGTTTLLGLLAEHVDDLKARRGRRADLPGHALEAAPYLGPILRADDILVQLIAVEHVLPESMRGAVAASRRRVRDGPGVGQIEDRLAGPSGWIPPRWGRTSSRGRSRPGCRHWAWTTWPNSSRSSTAPSEEMQALIEEVVVPESWFFRDSRPFEVLCQHARARRACDPSLASAARPEPAVRGGEEPYSIAMALIDAGLPPAQFQIDAVDVSDRALARARRGVYSLNAFRGPYSSFRSRYFHKARRGSPWMRR